MSYISELKKRCTDKLIITAKSIKDSMPYTTKNGVYDNREGMYISAWTNGFWAGILWELYGQTHDEKYADWAASIEERLTRVLYNYKECDLNIGHDLGFVWLYSGVESYRRKGNEASKNNALTAASLLAARYNPVGNYIRAWSPKEHIGKAIIDCMMNLPLLYWASDIVGDMRFANIAKCHADTTMKYFIRNNGSSAHIIRFDAQTGEYAEECEGQGMSAGSSWSRGQAWALCGFTDSYIMTGEKRYLDIALRAADYFVTEAQKSDYVIKSDFCQPEDEQFYDTSAAAVASFGLAKLYEATNDSRWYDAAKKLVRACDERFCPWQDKNDAALLNYGSERYKVKIQQPLIYGDMYFYKAVLKLDEIENKERL